jgi:hypothetical protein
MGETREVGAEGEEVGASRRRRRPSELGFGELGSCVGSDSLGFQSDGTERLDGGRRRREPAAAGSPHGFRGLGWAGVM